jgi:subtilisin-like proprotein convertase family protein
MSIGSSAALIASLSDDEIFSASDIDLIDACSIVDPNSNPLLPRQWYAAGNLSATTVDSRAAQVWSDYTGNGVSIAIVDIGFQSAHLDLSAQMGSESLGAYSSSNDHATQVAGVLGADANNNFGIAGIAYGAEITGVQLNYRTNTLSRSAVEQALVDGAASDIVNSSWGYRTQFQDSFSDSRYSGIQAAIIDGASTGRDGLGSLFVFAAGNDRQYVALNATLDGDNTNYHSLTNARQIITVAASDEFGSVASFSTPGASVLVAAPGTSIYTTGVISGAEASLDGFETVAGTSFSAPIVSGVIALMLEANPNLGYRDIQTILSATATRTGDASSWMENGAGWWNGGGMLMNSDLGAGVVNAEAAVRLAETWNQTATAANEVQANLLANQTGTSLLVDGGSVTRTFTASTAMQVEWAEVDVAITHSHVGDLTITLTSPSGLVSVLVDRPGSGSNTRDNLSFTLTSAQFRGEDPTGTWTVTITDAAGNSAGSVTQVSMRLFGGTSSTDTVHVFTDDFAQLAGRSVITDTDGNNTLNFAAVTERLELDLAAGAGEIDGKALNLAAGSTFGTVFGGNAGDAVSAAGQSAAFSLNGGRGGDRLVGGAGADTLSGDEGDDTLEGEGANDAAYGDIFQGGAGFDLVSYLASSAVQVRLYDASFNAGGAAGDMFTGVEAILGSAHGDVIVGDLRRNALSGAAGDDWIDGTGGEDTLSGGEGHDHLMGRGGLDIIDGGAGWDYARYDYADAGVRAYLYDLTQNSGFAAGDQLTSIEGLVGSGFNDDLRGDIASNGLLGGDGNDLLIGFGSRDFMYGGNGADMFFYTTASDGGGIGDVINDFASGTDMVVVNAMAFGLNGGNFQSIGAHQFATGTAATANHAQFVFNAATGELSFDADGTGSAAASILAVLQPGGTMTHADILVF